MITCYLRYEISPLKAKEFEIYAKMWMPLVEKFGGTHHGYFLPHEGGD
jgi:NIPSNAP protein